MPYLIPATAAAFDFSDTTWWKDYIQLYFSTLADVAQVRPPNQPDRTTKIRSASSVHDALVHATADLSGSLTTLGGQYARRVLEEVVDGVLRVYRKDTSVIVPRPAGASARIFIDEIIHHSTNIKTAMKDSFESGTDVPAMYIIRTVVSYFWWETFYDVQDGAETEWSLGPSLDEEDGTEPTTNSPTLTGISMLGLTYVAIQPRQAAPTTEGTPDGSSRGRTSSQDQDAPQ